MRAVHASTQRWDIHSWLVNRAGKRGLSFGNLPTRSWTGLSERDAWPGWRIDRPARVPTRLRASRANAPTNNTASENIHYGQPLPSGLDGLLTLGESDQLAESDEKGEDGDRDSHDAMVWISTVNLRLVNPPLSVDSHTQSTWA